MAEKINWRTVLASALATAITAAATIATGAFGYLNKDRSLDIEMVRISLSILSGENKDTSLNGRKFALRALSKFSGVNIPQDEFETWAESGTVPKIDLGYVDTYSEPLGYYGTSASAYKPDRGAPAPSYKDPSSSGDN